MTGIAVRTVVGIAASTPMFRIHRSLVVLVAIQAGKGSIVRCIRMAIGASIPFALVCTAVNGKILGIVIELGTLPGSDAVATFTILGEPRADVIWNRSRLIIGQMAGHAFLGQAGIRSTGMASRTIQLMTTTQREESMFETLVRPIPLPANHVVAAVAVGAESSHAVVGTGRRLVVGTMATVAIRTHDIIPLFRTRHMASVAIGLGMHSHEWKAHLTVDVLYLAVLDQPGFWRMAAGTIVADRLLVHIFVALVAIRRRLVKYKGGVALLAFDHFVLTHQREFCLTVIKILGLHIVPGCRRMAIAAFQLEALAMRGLQGKTAKGRNQKSQQ